MTIFGTNSVVSLITKVLILLFFLGVPLLVKAQDIRFCNENVCGDLEPNWELSGQTVVCEGENFRLSGSSSSPLNQIQSFHWFVEDIQTNEVLFDTLFNDTTLLTYNFTLSDSIACTLSNSRVTLQVRLVVQSETCGDGQQSCRFATKPLTVNLKPRAQFALNSQSCVGEDINLQNTGCHGDSFFWDFGDGSTSTEENPEKFFDQPGTYTIRLESTNDCGVDVSFRTLEVIGLPDASFNIIEVPDNFCLPLSLSLQSSANAFSTTTWEIIPNDTSRWAFTDTVMNLFSRDISIRFLQTGDYTIRLRASNVCMEDDIQEEQITIFDPPVSQLLDTLSFCDPATISSSDLNFQIDGDFEDVTWSFENADIQSTSGASFTNVSFNQTGRIIVQVSGSCGILSDTSDIIIANTAPIVLDPSNPMEWCQNAGPLQLNATPIGGRWEGPGGISPEGLVNTENLAPGIYQFTYNAGSPACPNADSLTVQILEPAAVDLRPIDPVCSTLNFTPNVQYNGEIDTYQWTFPGGNPASSNLAQPANINFSQPDTFLIEILVNGVCGIAKDSIPIQIQEDRALSIAPITQPICSSADPITLVADLPGGRWSGNGVNPNSGLFDPASVMPDQIYTIQYELEEGVCLESTSIDLQIIGAATVTTENASFCIDSAPSILIASPNGGMWSGSAALNSATGLFDPQVSGVGTFNVKYTFTDANSCMVNSEAMVTVLALPTFQTNNRTITVCLADFSTNIPDLLDFSVAPAEGITTWSGEGIVDPNVGIFNPIASGLTIGSYQITATHERGECRVSESFAINVIEAPGLEISENASICISENTFQLSSNLNGGRWSGPGIDQTGQIDLLAAGGGTFTYDYFLGEGSSCIQSASTEVTIIDLGSSIDTGPLQAICAGPATTNLNGASPANGFWRGPAILDAQTGLIDLNQLQMDTIYTFQYCLGSSAVDNCEACKPKSFILRSNPIADFTLPNTACIASNLSMVNNSIDGQSYSWDFGNGIRSDAFEPTISYEVSDTFSIRLEVESAFGCRSNFTQNLYVSAPPNVSFSLLDDEGCAPFEVLVNNQSSGDSLRQRWLIGNDTILGANLNNFFIDSIADITQVGILLEVENYCGADSQADSITINPYPQVSFGISEDEGCSPVELDLINNTLGNPDNFIWDFGNGTQSTLAEPPNQLLFAGRDSIEQYNISLIASNECGMDTLIKEVTVFPPDVEAFIELDTLSACQFLSFQLKSESTPGADIFWRVLGPTGAVVEVSNEEDPIITLNNPGIHTFILTASNCGSDTDTAQVEVLSRPNVGVSLVPFTCVGQDMQFNNLANPMVISGSIWDFGDGQTSTEFSPIHQYQEPGEYTYSLTVFSNANNCPNTATGIVTVIDNPEIDFTADQTEGCGPLLVNFTNLTEDKDVLNFIWDFGDGSSQVFDADPSHQFEQPGNYQVSLNAYTADSCFADAIMMNIIVFPDPVSDFELTSAINCVGKDALSIRDLSQDAVAYQWNINGQIITEDILPQILLNEVGNLPIELVVQNVFQCSDTSQQILNVLPSPNAAFLINDSIGCAPFSVPFQQESSGADRYLWDFKNGNTSTEESPNTVFREAGIYEVQMIAQNSNGCPSDTANATIEVLPKPTATFSFEKPAECGTPTEVIFTNESMDNPNNFWTFGDGTSSDETNPTYFYVDFGPKPVTLIVRNNVGCQDTTMQTVDIFGSPQASFDFSIGAACTSDSIRLINSSAEAITFTWKIGNRAPFEAISPTIIYDQAGIYPVQLIATYNDACQDTIQKDLIVYQNPTADFSYQADFDPARLGEVQFTNQSVFANRFLWDLGDGTITDETNVYHEYLVNRTLDVALIAYNDNNGVFTCSDTISKPVQPEWVTTFYAPNALAPDLDNDGVRFFKPVGTGLQAYEIQVYSPWGTIVWQSNDLENSQPTGQWDGTYQGEKLPQGAYVWVATMTFEDGNEQRRSGTVTIIR